jgi:hypothetical protein
MSAQPVEIHALALDNLRYIRRTIEGAGSFTAVPGQGGMWMGATAIIAAFAASQQPTPDAWLTVWIGEAILALAIGASAAWWKARRTSSGTLSAPARKFVLALLPSVFAATFLTALLIRANLTERLPAVWLLLYGTAVVSGGSFSVRVIPIMGMCFLGFGALAVFAPITWGNWLLAAAFGGVQILFGGIIARKFGG